MIINGREIGFAFTVGATLKVAQLCPDNDLGRIAEVLENDNYIKNVETMKRFITALSEEYEDLKAAEDAAYQPRPLTGRELNRLSPAEFGELRTAALQAMVRDRQTEVETEKPKKKTAAQKSS